MIVNFNVLNEDRKISFDLKKLLIVGYAGRDMDKTMKHIRELEQDLGVKPPSKIPTIFECSLENFTQSEKIKFFGSKTSGEVEYAIIKHQGKIYIGIDSDHTDRELEGIDVSKSKQVCPKPFGKDIVPYETLKANWDNIKLISHQIVNGKKILYQDGVLGDILQPEIIIRELEDRVGSIDDCVISSGTVVLEDGFKYGSKFMGALIDEKSGIELNIEYEIEVIPEKER